MVCVLVYRDFKGDSKTEISIFRMRKENSRGLEVKWGLSFKYMQSVSIRTGEAKVLGECDLVLLTLHSMVASSKL